MSVPSTRAPIALCGNSTQTDTSLPSLGDSHRLSILTRQEIDDLYGLPRFTDEDRRVYFDLSELEQRAVHARTVSAAGMSTTLAKNRDGLAHAADPAGLGCR